MEDKTEDAKAKRPSLFRSLFFQDASLFCIFSMMKKKSLFFGLPLRIGKLKYLSREVVQRMSKMEVIFPRGVPEE